MFLGFIIVRHVNSELTNRYWKDAYLSIRNYYDNKILIIDDNSDPRFLDERNFPMYDCEVIQSEFPGRGEILGYYYFLHLHPFEKAVILHDSCFVNGPIPFLRPHSDGVQFHWWIPHHWDDDEKIISLLEQFKDSETLIKKYHKKGEWNGCFGLMSCIEWGVVAALDRQFSFVKKGVEIITDREKRCCMERIFAVMVRVFREKSMPEKARFGNIFNYCQWGLNYDSRTKLRHLPLIKVWTGR